MISHDAEINLRETITHRVESLVCEKMGWEPRSLPSTAHVTDDLGIDSLDMVDILLSIEDDFRIDIPDEESERITTVGSLIKLVQGKLGASAPASQLL